MSGCCPHDFAGCGCDHPVYEDVDLTSNEFRGASLPDMTVMRRVSRHASYLRGGAPNKHRHGSSPPMRSTHVAGPFSSELTRDGSAAPTSKEAA